MLREFHPREDELNDADNIKRGQELQRLLAIYGNTQDYWMGEVVEDWRNELDYRFFRYMNNQPKTECTGDCAGCAGH